MTGIHRGSVQARSEEVLLKRAPVEGIDWAVDQALAVSLNKTSRQSPLVSQLRGDWLLPGAQKYFKQWLKAQ